MEQSMEQALQEAFRSGQRQAMSAAFAAQPPVIMMAPGQQIPEIKKDARYAGGIRVGDPKFHKAATMCARANSSALHKVRFVRHGEVPPPAFSGTPLKTYGNPYAHPQPANPYAHPPQANLYAAPPAAYAPPPPAYAHLTAHSGAMAPLLTEGSGFRVVDQAAASAHRQSAGAHLRQTAQGQTMTAQEQAMAALNQLAEAAEVAEAAD